MFVVPAATASSSSSTDSTKATCGAAALRSRRSLIEAMLYAGLQLRMAIGGLARCVMVKVGGAERLCVW